MRLKNLLYDQGYTIAGAKKKLRESASARESQTASPPPDNYQRHLLAEIIRDLHRLRQSLDNLPSASR